MSEASTVPTSTLTVRELASAALPDAGTAANGILMECMLYVMPEDMRTNLLGRTRPADLPRSVVDLISKPASTKFLNDFYAPTLIGLSLSQNTKFSSSFSPQQSKQLQYAASELLTREPAYTVINQAIFADAAIASSAVLKKYVDDGANWGQALYEHITQPAALAQVKVELFSTSSPALFNRYVDLLVVLDPSRELAQKYAGIVYYSHGVQQAAYAIDVGSEDLRPYVSEALPHLLDAIVAQWSTNPGDPTATAEDPEGQMTRQMIVQMLKDLQDTVESRQHLIEGIIQILGAGGAADDLVERLQKIGLNLGESNLFLNWVEGLAGKGAGAVTITDGAKGFRAFGAFVGMMAMGLSVYFASTALSEWDRLTTEEKAEAAAEAVQLVGVLNEGVSFLPNLLQSLGAAGTRMSRSEWMAALRGGLLGRIATGLAEFARGVYRKLVNTAARFMDRLVEVVPNVLRRLASRLVQGATFIGRFVRNGFAAVGRFFSALGQVVGKLIKGLVIVAQVAMSVLFIADFVRDIVNGAPITQTVLHGIQAISLVGSLIADAFAVATESMFAASISFAFVIVGLVAAIVAWILASPSPSPVELYIKSNVLPFANRLLADAERRVPAGWTIGRRAATATAASGG